MTTIHFATSNNQKFKDYADRFKGTTFTLSHFRQNLEEIQAKNTTEVARQKHKAALLYAQEAFGPTASVMVEDRGLFIPALNDFPGVFFSQASDRLGSTGFLRLMEGETDRRAFLDTSLFVNIGATTYECYHREELSLLSSAQGQTSAHGWGGVLSLLSSPHFPNKSLSELTNDEWKQYGEILFKEDVIAQFLQKVTL